MSERITISINRITQIAFLVATTLLIVLFALLVWQVASGQPDHDDLLRSQQAELMNQRSIICLLLVDPTERDEAAIAACQVDPETLFEP